MVLRNMIFFSTAAGNSKSAGARITCPVCKVVVVRRVYRRHYETMHCVQVKYMNH